MGVGMMLYCCHLTPTVYNSLVVKLKSRNSRSDKIIFQRFVLPISNHLGILEYLREIVVTRYKVPVVY